MVAETADKTIRTERLELVGPDGDVQIILQATAAGPRVELQGDAAEIVLRAANGRPRLVVASRPSGARVSLWSNEAEGLDPIAYLDTDGHQASLGLYTVMDDGLVEPRVMATSRRWQGSTEPRLCVYDEHLGILLEVPRTGESLGHRLEERVATALKTELADGDWGELSEAEIQDALHEATDNSMIRDIVQGLVRGSDARKAQS